ncbi:LOW QUALITY PROTEIN: protein O-mannosyl-transferase TMTC1-like [Palaemon carinicauda]|uniref:LOW QUALITY PROTEIN: protein O-mannosyl-transferase TMTC1-like n=1 Tax=Palaemon carinicauda TaxID=392227 RepID=UPI0035B6A69A
MKTTGFHVKMGKEGKTQTCQCSPKRRRKGSPSSHLTPSSRSSSPSLAVTCRRCDEDSTYDSAVEPPPTWVYMLVWIASVLVYLNGLNGDFVHDDISAITTNADVIGTNPISHVFLNDYWGKPMSDPLSHKSYRPFTILTFRANYQLFGLRPFGFHLVNILLHSCVCLLLTKLLLRVVRVPQGTALSAGLIFATHPIHTEAVTGVVGRADVLAAITFLAAILSYHRAMECDRNDIRRAYYIKEREDSHSSCCDRWESGKGMAELDEEDDAEVEEEEYTTEYVMAADLVSYEVMKKEASLFGDRRRNDGNESYEKTTREVVSSEGTVWVRRAGILAAAGTLCKENALTSLAVCAAWDLILHRKHVRRLFHKKPPDKALERVMRRLLYLSSMICGILFLRLLLQGGGSPVFSDQDNPAACSSSLITRALTFAYLPSFNGWLLLCPWKLSHDWQMASVPLLTSALDARNVFSFVFYGLLLLLFKAGWSLKGYEGRAVLLGLAMLVLPFLPATNLFFTVGFVVAERILYIPSVGWSLVVSIGLSRVGRLRAASLLLLMMAFSCRTVQRNRDWESRASLAIAGLKTLPHNAKMHYNYANLQKDLGNMNLAEYHYREAIRLWPEHSSAHNNLATLLNDTSEAETHFRLALKAHPQHARAYYNLASLKNRRQGGVAEAMLLLEKSLTHDASNKDAVSALAGMYVDAGRPADAERLHLTLLRARPFDPVVHNNYAAFLHTVGRKHAALHHYQTALDLDPEHTVALVNTAMLMRSLRHNNQAEILYKRALALTWDPEIGESLGKLYLNTGRLEEASLTFSTVLRLYPHMLSSRVYLARVKLQQKCYTDSQELLLQVLSQEPHHQEALFQLSLLYTYTNRSQDALALAHRAAHNCSNPPAFCAHIHAHYADLLKDRNHDEEAAQNYRVAVALEPSLTHAHVNLGALYHTKGNYQQAWHHYLTAHGGSLQQPTSREHGEVKEAPPYQPSSLSAKLPQQLLMTTSFILIPLRQQQQQCCSQWSKAKVIQKVKSFYQTNGFTQFFWSLPVPIIMECQIFFL